MAASRLQLFGTPALETAAGLEPLPLERPFQLLAYLACRGAWTPRDAAASLLWPDRDAATARANLRFVLVQIRRLPHVEGFEARADAIRWTVATDVRQFESAVAASDWAAAIDCCSGALLDGFEADAPAPFIEWLQTERARLAALWHNAVCARLADLYDDPQGRSALAVRALQADPLDEAALAAHLQALSALGRRDDARRAYRDYANRLAAELAIEPSAALRDLVRQLDPHEARAPEARTPAGAATPPGLIGRRVELGRVKTWLRDPESRALVIVGAGGVGKSALARAARNAFAEEMPGGAHWITLDDLRSIDSVVPRCATVLGLELRGAAPPARELQDRLRDTRALLVFDNAEHLPEFGAWLAALLAACSALKVIVTSRVRLELAGRQLLALDGLPAPDADETEIEALRAFDAVRLFEARAARAQPDFDVAGSAPDVAALVRTIDGLPLAIELAAAWVRVLPVAEIRREIERSLELLETGDDRHGRAYSVRDSLEHSWQLLAPAEQRALGQLAVFPGSFSRESARAVADASLPLLASLSDKSLLQTADNGRFALHPLIRQFAQEKLAQASADAPALAHARHGDYFLAQLARYNDFHALDQRAALQAIGADIENMLAAWRWAVAHRRIDLIENCASALESYLDARGQQQFGLQVLSEAATAIDENLPAHQLARSRVQLARAAFCYRRGDFREGEAAARAALQAAQRIKYRFGVQSGTNTLGLMLWRLGRMREAAFCLRDVLRRARADADVAAIPLYAVNLGRIELELGNDDEGERLVREALEGSRRVGSHAGIHAALNELCNLLLDQQRPDAVLSLAHEGLALCESSGFRRNEPYFHCVLAEAHCALGDLASSARHARVALAAVEAGGDRALEPACRVRLAQAALRAGDLEGALREVQAAARVAQAIRSPRVQVEVVAAYAQLCAQRGRAHESRDLFSLVAGHRAATRRQREAARAALARASSTAAGAAESAGPIDLDQAIDRLLGATS